MKIRRAVFAPASSAFFFDDQAAIKRGATTDGFVYMGQPCTPGFTSIRQAGQGISVMLELEDGQVALGDCTAVQYSGAGGRDPLFLCDTYLPMVRRELPPMLEGLEVDKFRPIAGMVEQMRLGGKPLHTALRYGISQALLDAAAKASRLLPCEVICREYSLPVVPAPIEIFGQSGDQRYDNVDKMILKQVDALPHGLINNVPEKLGHDGEKLREYIRWIVGRIRQLRVSESYTPDLHIDVYGTIGVAFDHDVTKICDYLASLQHDAQEFALYVEGPVDMGDAGRQIQVMSDITSRLDRCGSSVKIVADEWCNTLEDIRQYTNARACHMVQVKTPDLGGVHNVIEAVIYCNSHGVEAYQGGTCNETDISARMCVQLAMACRPKRMLAKPGMGFDEGFCIVRNEMNRTLAVLAARAGHPRETTNA